MLRILLTCIIGMLMLGTASAGTDEEVVNFLVKGNDYMGRNEPEKALGEFQKAVDYLSMVKANREFPVAYFNRGRAYERLGDLEKAVSDYSEAIARDPDYLLAYYHRAVTYHKMNELDRSAADYDMMIRLEPGVHAFNNRGLIFMQKGELEKAIADFDRAVKIDPKAVNVHLNRGLAHLNGGDYIRAAEDFYRERQINPGSPGAALFQTALQQVRERKFDEALVSFESLSAMGFGVSQVVMSDLRGRRMKESDPAGP